MYPTEIMDGAIVSGNCVAPCDKVTTYHHFHNPVIDECYKHHGKDINFMGVILTNENVFLADKERHSDMVAKFCTQFIVLVLNYIFSKFIIFTTGKKTGGSK